MTAEEDLQELRSTLDRLEEQIESDIQDVRDRVVQVKREVDTKAATDHDHESLREQLQALESDVKMTQETLESTEEQLEGGFENFEEILENLVERTANLETDVNTIGEATRSMQTVLDRVSEHEQLRAKADHLKQTAAARGVRRANCESCNATIDIALLGTPTCPSCKENFHTLDADPGFFGTSILETGDRPALEGQTTDDRADLDTLGEDTPDDGGENVLEWGEDESDTLQ